MTASGTSEDDGEAERGDSTFGKLTDALGDWLDTTEEQDEIAETRICEDRESRALQLETVERELEGIREQLDIVQDAIEETPERALRAISSKLDELDRDAEGFGADLLITPIRPADPEDTWMLLASAGGTVSRGQVLILDELVDSLGDQHRRHIRLAARRRRTRHHRARHLPGLRAG